jgi:hypothetical protein
MEGTQSGIIKLTNGAFFPIKGLLNASRDYDLTLIKVSGKNLPALPLGNSDALSVGDRVIAIGSPLGFQNTVSDGIVSGIRDDANAGKWVQTTAPASPGNSGGPLLNMKGEVVGVVTFRATGGENINFAAPANLVKSLLASAREPVPLGAQEPRNLGERRQFPPPPASARIWKSLTTGNEYSVWIENERLYAEWVNVPRELAERGAFTRTESRRAGPRWMGTSQNYRPCDTTENGKRVRNWCHVVTKIEFDSVEASRMTGRAEGLRRFDCANCKILETVWKDFEWVPKEPSPVPMKQ